MIEALLIIVAIGTHGLLDLEIVHMPDMDTCRDTAVQVYDAFIDDVVDGSIHTTCVQVEWNPETVLNQ